MAARLDAVSENCERLTAHVVVDAADIFANHADEQRPRSDCDQSD